MGKIFYGNVSLGGSGIVPVDTLPTTNDENYDKHELYLNGEDLYYLKKVMSNDFTLDTYYYYGGSNANESICQYVQIGDIIYYLDRTQRVLKYDITSNTSTLLKGYSGASYNFGGFADVDGDFIYWRVSYQYIYKYNYKTNESTLLYQPPQYEPTMNFLCGSTIYNGYLYTFGGKNGSNSNVGYIYKYSLTDGARSRVGSLVITNGYETKTARYGNIVYIFVSKSNASTTANAVWKYDLTNDTLTSTSLALNTAVIEYCLCYFNNLLYIIGGGQNVQIFDQSTETFSILSKSINATYSFAGTKDNNMYIGFGSNSKYVRKATYPVTISYNKITTTDVT